MSSESTTYKNSYVVACVITADDVADFELPYPEPSVRNNSYVIAFEITGLKSLAEVYSRRHVRTESYKPDWSKYRRTNYFH